MPKKAGFAEMVSFYKKLFINEKERFFLRLSVFFRKKKECSAIKCKQDALIVMKTLLGTPINAARKSYENGGAIGIQQEFPELHEAHAAGKRALSENILQILNDKET